MLNKINIANTILDGISRQIDVKPARCTRIKHKSSPCTLCHLNCPADAIKVGEPGMTINVDWEKCTGCGICINVCPTETYILRNNGYKELIENCCRTISPRGELTLVCSDAERIPGENAAACECIGLFNTCDIILLYLKGARKINFRLGICLNCKSKWGDRIIEREIEQLKALSGIFEDIKELSVQTEEKGVISITFPRQMPIQRPEKKEKPNPSLDRRGIFSFFMKNIKETAVKGASMVTVEKNEPRTKITFEPFMPARRKIFLDSIMQLGRLTVYEALTGKLFNNIQIEKACVYCGMCAKFCPTGALKIDTERTELKFNPSLCVSCMLCEKACYHGKLHYKDNLPLKDMFSDIIVIKKEESE